LIVDDDVLALRALEKTLRAEGFVVDTARTLDEARKLIIQEEYDAALIDLFLENGRGAALVAELRTAPRPCCAVMITGATRSDAARQAIAAGAEDFLIKPVQTELLFDSMRRTVERTRAWRSQVQRLDSVAEEPREVHLSVVTAEVIDQPAGQKTSVSGSKLLAWPPLPTLRALDIDRCAEAIAELGGLTEREKRILVPMLRGEQNADIVQTTGSSQRTVKFHVSNILKKLRVTHRNELLRFLF
jgi:DNA-binding NarL/FixJ family response regulator